MKPDKKKHEPVIENRQARFNYHIEDTVEAGLVLKGSEVKSIREGSLELKEAYIHSKNGELYLEGAYIKPYGFHHADPLNPTRPRKLLLNRREINRMAATAQQGGMTIVPLKAYFKKGRVKLEIGLGKGKKTAMKRETIKKREAERNLRRARKFKV